MPGKVIEKNGPVGGKETWGKAPNTTLDIGIVNVESNGVLTIAKGTEVWVREDITVEGGTLVIEEGVKFYFMPRGGYQSGFPGAGLSVDKGTIKANGLETARIWFTSWRTKPMNGDWGGIGLMNVNSESYFNHVIVEYGSIGIEQTRNDGKNTEGADIRSSIVRWSNIEGIYAENSSFAVEKCLLYQNGGHEIALEKHNKEVKIEKNVFHSGMGAINIDTSGAIVKGNWFCNYNFPAMPAFITASWKSDKSKKPDKKYPIKVVGNKYYCTEGGAGWPLIANADDHPAKIIEGVNTKLGMANNNECLVAANNTAVKNVEEKGRVLGYSPGSIEDKYPYVYDRSDKTRCWVERLHGFAWGLAWGKGNLWFLGGNGLNRLDPITNTVKTALKSEGHPDIINISPQALTFDSTKNCFWVIDDATTNVFRLYVEFKKNLDVKSYSLTEYNLPKNAIPFGIACDGKYLYLGGYGGNVLLQCHIPAGKQNNLVIFDEIQLQYKNGKPLYTAGAFCWCGDGFWSKTRDVKSIEQIKIFERLIYHPVNNLKTIKKIGEDVYSMYPVAVDTIGITWGGGYLWTMQKACETRHEDGHVFKIKKGLCLPPTSKKLRYGPPLLRKLIPSQPVLNTQVITRGRALGSVEVLHQGETPDIASAPGGSPVALGTAFAASDRLEELSSAASRSVAGLAQGHPAIELRASGAIDGMEELPAVGGKNLGSEAPPTGGQPVVEIMAHGTAESLEDHASSSEQGIASPATGPAVELTASGATDSLAEVSEAVNQESSGVGALVSAHPL